MSTTEGKYDTEIESLRKELESLQREKRRLWERNVELAEMAKREKKEAESLLRSQREDMEDLLRGLLEQPDTRLREKLERAVEIIRSRGAIAPRTLLFLLR